MVAAQLAVPGCLRGRQDIEHQQVIAQVHRAQATAVRASTQELRVRAVAEANLRLAIDKAPSVPRPPRPPRAASSGQGKGDG